MQLLKGLTFMIVGLILWGTAISVGISWLALCFGSVILGLLLLFFAPHILLLPPSLILVPANGCLFLGYSYIKEWHFQGKLKKIADEEDMEDMRAIVRLSQMGVRDPEPNAIQQMRKQMDMEKVEERAQMRAVMQRLKDIEQRGSNKE